MLQRCGRRSRSHRTSQEVVGHARGKVRHLAKILRSGLEDGEVDDAVGVDGQDGGDVAATVAVVGGGPDSDEGVIEHGLIAFHNELMGPTNQVDFVLAIKFVDDVTTEEVASTTWTHTPSR